MGQIIEFQGFKESKAKILELRKSLEELIFERDHLKFVVCKNLKTNYLLEFGVLENSLYRAYCDYLRLRRKKELIQAKLNRQEEVGMEEIEKQLDDEFGEYEEKLNQKIYDLGIAFKQAELDFLTDEDSKLIKKLYKGIVKRIHPDINPLISEDQQELFYKATEAYENGDLTTIQIIFEIVSADNMDDIDSLSPKTLKDEVKRLEDLIETIKADIDSIQTSPPYIWKIYLEDYDKTMEKRKELNEKIDSYKEAIMTEEVRINNLLGYDYEWFGKKRTRKFNRIFD